MQGRQMRASLIFAAAVFAAGASVARAAPGYDAASNFAIHCMGCHRFDGKGSPPEVPSLAADFARLIRTAAGREYVLRVPGVSGSTLTDPETTDVLNWILEAIVPHLQRATVAPFTLEEVAAARRRPLLNVRSERARVLSQTAGRRP